MQEILSIIYPEADAARRQHSTSQHGGPSNANSRGQAAPISMGRGVQSQSSAAATYGRSSAVRGRGTDSRSESSSSNDESPRECRGASRHQLAANQRDMPGATNVSRAATKPARLTPGELLVIKVLHAMEGSGVELDDDLERVIKMIPVSTQMAREQLTMLLTTRYSAGAARSHLG